MAIIYNEDIYLFKFELLPDMYEEHTFEFPIKTGDVKWGHSYQFNCFNVFGKWVAGSDLKWVSLPYSENIVVRSELFGFWRENFGRLHIELMSETSTSAKIKCWVECYGPRFWYNALAWNGTLRCRTENATPDTGSQPTGLLCEGSLQPLSVKNSYPHFSAIFNDLNGTAKQVQMYVATQESLLVSDSPDMWNSGWISRSLSDKERCQDIVYDGSSLNMENTIYYWKIRFKDTADTISDWSSHKLFRTKSEEPPPPPPIDDAPTDLLCEGETYPRVVTDQSPEFSAINNMQYPAVYYHIIVSKKLSGAKFFPSKPYIWDSDWISMSETEHLNRCSDISYGSSLLPIDDTTYYWAIQFKDTKGGTSNWSLAAVFTMSYEGKPPPPSPATGVYRIQVNTQSDFQGTMMWDSGNVYTDLAFEDDIRSPDFEYAGEKLDLTGRMYYWRIKLWNVGESEGPWSIESAFFSGPSGGEVPSEIPEWVTDQYRDPTGKAEVELVVGSNEWTDLEDLMTIQISNNKNPLDNIETAQATVYLSNIDKKFYSENEASEFYKKLHGKKIRLSIGAFYEGSADLYRKMVGIIKSVSASREAKTAEIVALEFLDYYKTRRIHRTPVYKDITIFELFCELVRYCFPNWKNQHETADWDYFVAPLGFRQTNVYLGVGNGGADYTIKNHSKSPPELVRNIVADTEQIYKNGKRLRRGTDYTISQTRVGRGEEEAVNGHWIWNPTVWPDRPYIPPTPRPPTPKDVASVLHFLKDYPTADDSLYGSFTVETTVEVVQFEDTTLIEELEKIALVADCRIFANQDGKLVCKSNAPTDVFDSIAHNTHLLSLSSREDVDGIVNHVIVESKPYFIGGERTTLGSWDVSFETIGGGQSGAEHAFEFGEYATELLFDLTWDLECFNIWGTYVGTGTKVDFILPGNIEIIVTGMWGPQSFGYIHVETSDVDSKHISVKLWLEVALPRSWYVGMDFSATLTCKGITIGQPVTFIGEAIDEASFHSMWIGEKKQEFTLDYLEPGIEMAQQAAESLLSVLCRLKTYFDCSVRGMPHLRLLDTVALTDPFSSLDEETTQVIELSDSLKVADYKTSLGLVKSEVPVVATPHYWTPEWHDFIAKSEADEVQTYKWTFRTETLGFSFRHEWTLKFHSPHLFVDASGANYDFDLPYTETISSKSKTTGESFDFATVAYTKEASTANSVTVKFELTLVGNWLVDSEFTASLACIPEFSYEATGPMALPHYPKSYPSVPPDEQPTNGYYYEADTFIGIGSGMAYPLNNDYESILDSIASYNLNIVRFSMCFDLKESLSEACLTKIYNFCSYAKSKNITAVISISNKQVLSAYSDWSRQAAIIVRLCKKLKDLTNIIWETGNELTQGFEYEEKIVQLLRSLSKREIMSSALRDMEKIKPYVDFFSYHNTCSKSNVDEPVGRKTVYDTDGCSLSVLTASNLYQIAKKALRRGSSFFFDEGLNEDGSLASTDRLQALQKAYREVAGGS